MRKFKTTYQSKNEKGIIYIEAPNFAAAIGIQKRLQKAFEAENLFYTWMVDNE